MSVLTLSSAGWLPIKTLIAPAIHGAGVTGMQGIGVSTPIAAAVADATAGFAGQQHIPNGMMFVIGMWSMMLAAGAVTSTRLMGSITFSALGAIPKLHCSIA